MTTVISKTPYWSASDRRDGWSLVSRIAATALKGGGQAVCYRTVSRQGPLPGHGEGEARSWSNWLAVYPRTASPDAFERRSLFQSSADGSLSMAMVNRVVEARGRSGRSP